MNMEVQIMETAFLLTCLFILIIVLLYTFFIIAAYKKGKRMKK